MKRTWSHKLFLRINATVGTDPFMDALMLFSARWLIFILLGGIVVHEWIFLWGTDPALFYTFIILLQLGIIVGVGTNWIMSIIMPHPRPIVEFPHIRQICPVFQTVKSFPSDHTTIAFLTVFLALYNEVGMAFVVLAGLPIASLIAVSRIYVGVHYPRDIVGGVVAGLMYASFMYLIAMSSIYPLMTLLV